MNFFTILFFLLPVLLSAKHPLAFESLAKSFDEDLKTIQMMREQPYFIRHRVLFDTYEKKIHQTFALGFDLDAVIQKGEDSPELTQEYLKALRVLENDQKVIDKLYVDALNSAIKNSDMKLFSYLLKCSIRPLKNERVRERVLNYYERQRSRIKIMEAETLRQEQKIDAYSRQVAFEEQNAYEEHLKVLSALQAKKVRQSADKARRNSVLVFSNNVGNSVEFYAENFNVYDVTLTLKLNEMHNFVASKALPVFVELGAGQRQKILMLERDNTHSNASYKSSYGWVMGIASARHDNDFLYRVPFKKGTQVHVSQGYNGKTSHHGYARNAVDFSAPVGTAVYAARGGKVIATKSSGMRGGFDRSYGKYANFIVIEHDDKTFGKYYHLKYDGVAVNVGQHVAQGDLIGYSGNTGYSSGPHLHFSVSKVDPKYRQRPITLPFKLQTAAGVVRQPRQGDVYVVN